MGNLDIKFPSISIIFKGLGSSAVQRSEKGYACLIVKDNTGTDAVHKYKSIDDFTTEEQAKFTQENVLYIKDVLEGTPKELLVFRMLDEQQLADILKVIKVKAPRNCWIAIADAEEQETTDLVSFVKSAVEYDHKRYKALVYKNESDFKHIHNYTNENVTFVDNRGKQTGDKAVPYLMGYLAGLPMTMSAIAKPLPKFIEVEEPEDLDVAISKGEFVLYNDEDVRVARGVNSLVTTGEGVVDSMKFIQVVEIMDLIYNDIYTTWNKFYKGKYQNNADNQALLIGAINAYFDALELDDLLDRNFENKAFVDLERQRLANIPKYGEEVVRAWSEEQVKTHTYMSDVYLSANIKVLQAMEDFYFVITM